MDTNFTKEEWLTCDDAPFIYALNNDGVNKFSLMIDGNGKNGASDLELKANANLISCSPEMYELLEKITNIINMSEDDDILAGEMHEVYREIDILKTKARGEIK